METTPEDKKKAYQKKYRAEHKEAAKIANKKYRIEKSEHIKQYGKKYRLKNASRIKENYRKYRLKNVEKCRIRVNLYKKKNFEHIKEYQNQYNKDYKKNRKKSDPIFRMVCNLRCRIYDALKSQGAKKDIKTKELFGASQEFVRKHLESHFKEGMTRENYGRKGWHIDHIKPMSSFNLSDPEQLKECCHYTNLQPLWWWENLQKSDKCDILKVDETY